MVPAGEASSFELVEAQLALQVLVDTLGAPSLHDKPDELAPGDVLGQGRDEVVGRLLLAVAPLDEEPLGVALRIDTGRCHPPEREAGTWAQYPDRCILGEHHAPEECSECALGQMRRA